MIAAVFDCMVYLQAATSDRSPALACLNLVESNQVQLYISPPILAEVQDVLTRPKIKAKFPHLTPSGLHAMYLPAYLASSFIGNLRRFLVNFCMSTAGVLIGR
jgi:predicted nucleic acid-binding protein